MKMMRSYCSAVVLFILFGLAIGTEHYTDYAEDNADRDMENSMRGIYRLLLGQNSFNNDVGSRTSMGSPYQHLIIPKSQRSPSLRLRFGRSEPAMPPANLLPRSGSNDATFGDN